MASHSYEERPTSTTANRRQWSSTEEHLSDNTYNASSTVVDHSDNSESVHSPTHGSRCSSGFNPVNHAEPCKRGSGQFQLRNRQEHPHGRDHSEALTKESVNNSTSASSNRARSQTSSQAQAQSPTCSSSHAEGASSLRAAPHQQRTTRPRLLDMVTDLSSLENDYRVLPLLIGCIVPVSPMNLFESRLSGRCHLAPYCIQSVYCL